MALERLLCQVHNLLTVSPYLRFTMSAANERASTTRQRERGQRCAVCSAWLGGAAWANLGRRHFAPCSPRPHAVFMHFQQFGSWRVTFSLLPDQKHLARTLHFANSDKLVELARRAQASEEMLRDLEHSINTWGRGTVTLRLTDAQLRVLM